MTIGKKSFKFIFGFMIKTFIISCILFYALMLSSCSKIKKIDNVMQFEETITEVYGANTHIPDVEELGEYESIELLLKETNYGLWIINSLTLKARYNTSEFENELHIIDSKYSFLKEAKKDLFEYNAVIDGYEIQVVDKAEKMQDDYSYDYPKCFMMIGVNRQEKTIVYLYHYDIDLDYIEDLDDFIDRNYILE